MGPTGQNKDVGDDRFDAVYRDCYWPVVRYLARRVGDDTARDLAAEVFAVAWRRRRSVPLDPLPWLYGVARRVVANETRRRGREERLARRLRRERPLDHTADPRPDDGTRVDAALQHLSPADQEVLRLVAWERLTTDQLAVTLQCSRSAAAMRLSRARERLRSALGGDTDLSETLRRTWR